MHVDLYDHSLGFDNNENYFLITYAAPHALQQPEAGGKPNQQRNRMVISRAVGANNIYKLSTVFITYSISLKTIYML